MPMNEVKSIANRWLGTRYRYGGGGASGIDCSHFVWEVLKEAGYSQAPYIQAGDIPSSHFYTRVSPQEVVDGDIVHFSGGDPHIGIVVDPRVGMFIGAQSSTGVASRSYTEGYWSGRRPTFYRYLGN